MWLREIEADRLRNLKAVSLTLASGLTMVTGRNGQGKTTLLEAAYLLGTGRSFRTRRLDDLIQWDGGPMRAVGLVEGRYGKTRLSVVMDGKDRRLLVEGAESDLEHFIGRLDVVDLNGERMKVLRGGPEDRRRFLDRGVVGMTPSFLRSLGDYRRALLQRNALLRQGVNLGDSSQMAQLSAWDERLVRAGAEIHRRRREYALALAARLGSIGGAIFARERDLVLRYRPSPAAAGEASGGEFEKVFATALEGARSRDIGLRHTGQGPHRDEVAIELDGVDLRRFGSAGQVRAAMVALKLAKLALLQEDRHEAPLFLLDDFDSDLDEIRASSLAGFLEQGGFQALVATSKEGMADRLGVPFSKIRIDDGSAKPC